MKQAHIGIPRGIDARWPADHAPVANASKRGPVLLQGNTHLAIENKL